MFCTPFQAGCVSGALCSLSTKPLDILTKREQSGLFDKQTTRPKSLIAALVYEFSPIRIASDILSIGREEGYNRLLSGALSTCLTSGIAWGTFYSMRARTRRITSFITSVLPLPPSSFEFLNSATAALAANLIVTPFFTVRSRMYVQQGTSSRARGFLLTARDTVRAGGWSSLWAGLGWTQLGGLSVALRFSLYDRYRGHPSWAGPFRAMGLSMGLKALCSGLLYPTQILKTRLQLGRDGSLAVWRNGTDQHWGELVRGLGTVAWKQLPNAALNRALFEILVRK